MDKTFVSCFDVVFDAAVLGGGYAGFAAALALRQEYENVLLIEPRGDLVWESGRAFTREVGECDHPTWEALMGELASRGAAADGLIDAPMAEVMATRALAAADVRVLYYAWPVSVEMADDRVASLLVGTKDGLRRVAARRWVDASERGDLLRMCGGGPGPREPEERYVYAGLQRPTWPEPESVEVEEDAELSPGLWPSRRDLCVHVGPEEQAPWRALLPALRAAQETVPQAANGARLVYWGTEAFHIYGPGSAAHGPANVTVASPGCSAVATASLADRFDLGIEAAEELAGAPAASTEAGPAPERLPDSAFTHTVDTDVLVAGLGTGGAVAAMAAGRQFGSEVGHVLGLEPVAMPGGTGTVGCISGYYFGVPGGLQQEIDERTLEVMEQFGDALAIQPSFHPFAKSVVLDEMMREAGVDVRYGAMVWGVSASGGAVQEAYASLPEGTVRVRAGAFIDGTGDGDLCAAAGADYRLGRYGDSRLHAYSQSCGFSQRREDGGVNARHLNFDAGWCEPYDADDLTRARLRAVADYAEEEVDEFGHADYIAPLIGVRQGRLIETDYVLDLKDMLNSRRFDDAVGWVGCWLDNHSLDIELESHELVFWMWHARSWRVPVGCQLPYRCIVPAGLDNVWIAARCLGVTQNASYSVRMERDIQRAGEAAGYAATLAVQHGVGARNVPYEELKAALDATGALTAALGDPTFRWHVEPEALETPPDQHELIEEALIKLDEGRAGRHLAHLYFLGDRVADRVRRRLEAGDERVQWYAAGICAMWGDEAAEERLLQALRTGEWGYDDDRDRDLPYMNGRDDWTPNPMDVTRLAPNWLTAIRLLGLCGGEQTLATLEGFAADADHSLDTRVAIALAVELLAQRGRADADRAAALLRTLTEGDIPGRVSYPKRKVPALAERARRVADLDDIRVKHGGRPGQEPEDHIWQLHVVIARARLALGLPAQEAAESFVEDERGFVRRAFREVLGTD